MDKSIVQQVFEFVASCGREATTREVLANFPSNKASAITFALSRLARSGDLRRTAHGRYSVNDQSTLEEPVALLDDPYLMFILERVRPVLEIPELLYLHGLLSQAASHVSVELAKLSRRRRCIVSDASSDKNV